MFCAIVLISSLFGLLVGSFLNVLILRVNTGKSVGGRSSCMSCGHQLTTLDLIPVFSYVFLFGKCRHCGSRISLQYPLVELSTAVLYGLSAYVYWPLFTDNPNSFSVYSLLPMSLMFVIMSLLIAVSVYDLRHKIIPDQFVYPLIVFSGIWHFITFGSILDFNADFWAGPIFFAVFALLWLVSRGRWMGLGDAKLVLAIGLLLGLLLGLGALMLAFWSGAIVGIIMLLLSKSSITMKSEIPFAPFLILGAIAQLLLPIQLTLI